MLVVAISVFCVSASVNKRGWRRPCNMDDLVCVTGWFSLRLVVQGVEGNDSLLALPQ